ncbi:heavy metal translocating P-type ATPase metal-binding domain-containing protein [Sphingobacterium sp. DN00404]|uniref:Heavy metal translocating P-type ATPase metal-binding domain-containing protein n=1 Tax=Sphingobacterium micropteri TaxID=2763501 RepID=A0ABR7YNT6_9SPHI|nr:heavy metal translocating P-type ATPase metal-binding domain-containing protein [Sphingobacterium micropteri]MBD1433013.1 heavy metal translocating P-type ATPase metal-binding domain-containing protein [Sphingobacterium micropteri]
MRESEQIVKEKTCFHCGDKVDSIPYVLDNRNFCCLGCQTVYQVLNESNLHNYYRYNQHPGKSQKGPRADLSYLDEPNIVTKLVDYKDEDVTMITFYIPVIHCSSCIWLLEHLYKLHVGIKSSQVDFMKKQANITFKHQEISLRELVELLVQIGYEPKITLQDVVKEGKKLNQRGLIAKITVAGFCFGNSMMISFPEYFGMAAFEQQYASFFGYMNLAFGIPVLLYSASDYFKSAWLSLKQKRLNLDVPLALGIFVLFFRSAFEILTQTGPGFMDTLCSLVFFILIGKWVQQRTYYHISFERDYRSYFPVAVTVIEEESEKPIQIADLKVGQRILVRNNEIVPADAILLKGNASVDFSFVTGESKAVDKTWGEIIYAGGRQIGEAIELEVVKPVSQSYLTRLWNNESFKTQEKKFDTFIDFISKYFTVALISIAIVACIFWLIGGDSSKAWGAFTAVLIIACPCALALSSPFTLSAALSIFDRNKFYIKNTAAIEQLSAIDCVVFDKTGTISSPKSSLMLFEGELDEDERSLVSSVCRNSNHPLSREIVKWIGHTVIQTADTFKEITGKGMEAWFDAIEIKIGSAPFLGIKNEYQDGSVVYIMINEMVKGYFTLEQSWRQGLSEVVGTLNKGEYDLHLISGDNERRSDALKLIFPSNARLLFNQSPSDKLHKINFWQDQGKQVCMLGDGLNDAGALRKANLGIAVSDDINNFSPGCDAILDGDSFAKLPSFFAFAKDAVKVIHMSFAISLTYNVVGLSFAVQGTMSPLFAAILMPISTVTIISFTSLTTRWFAKRRKLLSKLS